MAQDLHQLVLLHGREMAREMVPEERRPLVDIAAEVLADDVQRIGISYAGFALTALPHKRLADDAVWEKADVPVLLLAGSADPEIIARALGDRVRVVPGRCERNATVLQVVNRSGAKSSILGGSRGGAAMNEQAVAKADAARRDVLEFVNTLAKGESVFFATNKPVLEVLQPDLAPGVLAGHFGKLRGRNEFAECRIGVIFGREQAPATSAEAIARALWASPIAAGPRPLSLTVSYRIRLAGSSGGPPGGNRTGCDASASVKRMKSVPLSKKKMNVT
jgi:hypothetical protein